MTSGGRNSTESQQPKTWHCCRRWRKLWLHNQQLHSFSTEHYNIKE